MTTPYFIYNGTNSSSLGLQIEQMSSLPVPARKYEYTDIPGADGQLVRDYGAYEDVQIEVRFNCMKDSRATPATLNAWLTGTGTLIHFDAPTYYYRVKAVQMPTRYRYRPWGNNYDSISVIFFCEPYRYMVDPGVLRPTPNTSYVVQNTHNTASLPKLTMTGTNPMTVTITNEAGVHQITIAAPHAYVDTKAKIVHNGTDPLNSLTTLLDDKWPRLEVGSNTFQFNNISSIDIEPVWREL